MTDPDVPVAHFDRAAEQSALGAAMIDSRRVWDVFDVVQPADFHEPRHETIATAILRLANRGEATDSVLVVDELLAMGVPAHLGLPAYVHELTGIVPTAANANYYAIVVAKHAARRRLAQAVLAVKQISDDASLPPEEALEQARAALDALTGSGGAEVRMVGDSIDELIASLSVPPELTPSPWRDINDVIGGFRAGAMYVVGARPAAGKTTFGLNAAIELAKSGTVAFVSLEMGEGELQKRMLAQLGDVNLGKLVNHSLDDSDANGMLRARDKIARMPLAILADAGATVAKIRGFARSVSRAGQLSGLVVDYVGLLQGGDALKSRQQVLGEFSRAMKLIAQEFQIPVIVLSQLNRKSEERPNKRPMLSDLRESGDLEQDCDVAFLLSRDLDDPDRAGEVDVQIAKNRHGATGDVALAWQGHYSRMVNMHSDFDPFN